VGEVTDDSRLLQKGLCVKMGLVGSVWVVVYCSEAWPLSFHSAEIGESIPGGI